MITWSSCTSSFMKIHDSRSEFRSESKDFDIIYTAGDELIRMGGISSGGHVTIPIRSLLFSLPPQAFC